MNLEEFFKQNTQVAVAFSGGVDSAYLLYAASRWAKNVCAYYVKSQFQPAFELEDAKRLTRGLGAQMKILEVDVLTEEIAANPENRCYYCKKLLFSEILKAAAADGFGVVLDGTNASDVAEDRPGMRAIKELQVKSPLRECGLTKTEIRRLSKEAGLFTWNKPAYACLATRIMGEPITEEKLLKTEKAEEFMVSLGFSDFRVRTKNGEALIQVKKEQLDMANAKMVKIENELKKYYSQVILDLANVR